MTRLALFVAIGLVAAACGAGAAGDGVRTDEPPQPPDGDWELAAGSSIVAGWPITLTIEGSEAGGRGACNGYFASLTIDGFRISFSELGATAMACEPPVMDAESQYFEALGAVERYTFSDDRLVLSGEDVELTFSSVPAVPTAELTGTTWQLEGLVSGEAVTSPASGTEAMLRLDADGTLVGSTGCRELTGTWIEAGGEIVFTDFAAHGECSPDLADQDGFVVTVLGDGFRATIDGDTVTLTSVGDEGLVYRTG